MFLIFAFDLEFTFISSGFALIKKKTDNKLNPIIKKFINTKEIDLFQLKIYYV